MLMSNLLEWKSKNYPFHIKIKISNPTIFSIHAYLLFNILLSLNYKTNIQVLKLGRKIPIGELPFKT